MIVVALTLLLVWLYAEVALLLYVSHHIGGLSALLLTIVSGGVGYVVARRQGAWLFRKMRREFDVGAPTIDSLLDGAGLLAAGILMIIPGLITDMVGAMLMIPPIRRAVVGYLFRNWQRRTESLGAAVLFRRAPTRDDDPVIDGTVERDGPDRPD